MQEQKNVLTEHGLKGTRARVALLHILEEEQRPLAVAELSARLKQQKILTDQATVYRILDIFSQKGLINRFEFQEGKFRYEMAGNDHHHLICEQCGRIEDMSDCNVKELETDIRHKKNFLVKRHALEFYGICHLCQS